MNISHLQSRNIKKIFVSAVILALGVIMFLLITNRNIIDTSENIIPKISSNAEITVEKIEQVYTKNGIKQWSLKAEKGDYYNTDDQAALQNIDAVYYGVDGKETYLTSDKGLMDINSKNITVFGNVIIKNEKFQVKSDEMKYNDEKRTLYSDTNVKIYGDSFDFVADSFQLNIDTEILELNGDVKGEFSGSPNL